MIKWYFCNGIFKWTSRELRKLNSPKVNDPMKKWANELYRAFSKKFKCPKYT
jgi:hypothetical protein